MKFEMRNVRPLTKEQEAAKIYAREKQREYLKRRKEKIEEERKPFVDLVLSLDDYQRDFLCGVFNCHKQNLIGELINLKNLLKSLPELNR